MEGEFEQIMAKIRWSIKENSYLTGVSFIDLYFVFPINFRGVLTQYKHCNFTEPYCDTITEPWLYYLESNLKLEQKA